MPATGASLTTLSYAKNPEHQRFVLRFEGQIKGRYHLMCLQMAGILGGPALRAEIERDMGNVRHLPDDWTPARDMVLIFDRAVRAGVSVERMGELIMPTYRDANPGAFEGRTVADALEILEVAYRQNTSYGGVSPGLKLGPNRASVFRRNSILPCQYFVGVIKGLLQLFSARGSVTEVECQWTGKPVCWFEATWTPSKR